MRPLPTRFVFALLVAAAGAAGSGCRPRHVLALEVNGAGDLPAAWSRGRLLARATFSDGTHGDVTTEASWRTSDPDLVRVGPDGTVDAVRRGRATITASLDGVEGAAAVEVRDVRQVAAETPAFELGAMGLDGAGRILVVGSAWVESAPGAMAAWRPMTSPPSRPARRVLAASRGTATSPLVWDPVAVTTPAPAVDLAAGDMTLVVNPAGLAAVLFRAENQEGTLAFVDADGWRWTRPVPAAETAIAIDDAGVVFAAHPGPAPGVLRVERLDAAGRVDVTEFPAPSGRRPVLSSVGGRTLLLIPGAGTRLFEGGAWGAVAPLPAELAEPSLRLRGDGAADLVGRSGDAVTHRRFDGTAWGDPVVVATSASAAAVAFGPGGTLAAAYVPTTPPGGTARLLVLRFDGVTWAAPVEIAAPVAPGTAPVIVASEAGRYAVLWRSGELRLWASAFDGAPPVAQSLRGVIHPSLIAAALRPGGDLIVLGAPDDGLAASACVVTYTFGP